MTKNEPGKFDCYQNAYDDEPVFTLRAKDPQAASLVRKWANERFQRLIRQGEITATDAKKLIEAWSCAHVMEKWWWENPNRRNNKIGIPSQDY